MAITFFFSVLENILFWFKSVENWILIGLSLEFLQKNQFLRVICLLRGRPPSPKVTTQWPPSKATMVFRQSNFFGLVFVRQYTLDLFVHIFLPPPPTSRSLNLTSYVPPYLMDMHLLFGIVKIMLFLPFIPPSFPNPMGEISSFLTNLDKI